MTIPVSRLSDVLMAHLLLQTTETRKWIPLEEVSDRLTPFLVSQGAVEFPAGTPARPVPRALKMAATSLQHKLYLERYHELIRLTPLGSTIATILEIPEELRSV